VFTKTKASADYVLELLHIKGYAYAGCTHGDKSQEERNEALQKFIQRKQAILVATDVAARGLDVDDVSVVINYELPQSADTYVHRVGRTGRAGKTGIAFSLVTSKDNVIAPKLVQILENAKAAVPPELAEIAERAHRKRKERNKRTKAKIKAKTLAMAIQRARG